MSILPQLLAELESASSAKDTKDTKPSKLTISTSELPKSDALPSEYPFILPRTKSGDLSQSSRCRSTSNVANNCTSINNKMRFSQNLNKSPKKDKVSMWVKYRNKLFNSAKKVHPLPVNFEEIEREKSMLLEFSAADALDVLNRLTDILILAEEDLDIYLPLLSPIIQAEVPDTAESKKIGPEGRTLLLSGLFVRMLDKITERRPCAILIDDAQVIDSASVSIIMHIIRRCKNVLVVIANSPLKGWRARTIPLIEDLASNLQIHLDNHNFDAVGEVLKIQFEVWANEIDPAIVDMVKRQSQGEIF